MGEIQAREFPSTEKEERKLKTFWRVVIVLLLFFSLPLSLLIWRLSLDFRSEAGPTDPPVEVVVSNITDSSVTISFQTPNHKTKAIVNFEESGSEIKSTSLDSRNSATGDGMYSLHYHNIVNLQPNTSYTFSITTGTENYSNENYKFTTAQTLENAPTPLPIFGRVEGTGFEEGIVYVHIEDGLEDSTTVSSLLPESGAYTLDLGNAKFGDGRSIDGKQIYVFVNASTKGKGSTTSTNPNNPIPTITLSQTTENYSNSPSSGNQPATNTTIPTQNQGTNIPTITPTNIPTPIPTAIVDDNVNYSLQQLSTTQIDLGGIGDSVAPQDVFISNIGERGFSVNWRTQSPTVGSVAYGVDSVPEFQVLDSRDSEQTQQARYTHSVDLFFDNASSDSTIALKLISNNIEYPTNSTLNVKLPKLLNSPPSPVSQDGSIQTTYSNSDDFLVFAKVDNSSTWVSTVPQSNSTNWNLSLGNLRNNTLDQLYSVTDDSTLNIIVYGPQNSKGSLNDYFGEDIKMIPMEKGLNIENITNNQFIPPQGLIRGTSSPNTIIEIEIDGQTSTIKSNSAGEWVYILPIEIGTGPKILTVRQGNDTITVNFTVQALEDLPVTSLEDFLRFLPAIILILAGLYLSKIAKQKVIE